jgi:flagellar basal body P-ring protein FlgI
MIRITTRRAALACLSVSLAGIVCGVGCSGGKKKTPLPVTRYQTLPLREVPPYLADTILQKTDLLDTGPFIVTGYGLVANLQDTGGGPYPNRVRDYMVKEMVTHGFGSKNNEEFKNIQPEQALDSKRFAIVEVIGLIPPGARKDQRFDVLIKTLDSSDATSLAHGNLYQTDLHIMGTNEVNPAGAVNVYSRAQGPVFVNPAYAVGDAPNYVSAARPTGPTGPLTGAAKLSLRNGMIMTGGRCMIDRPLRLQLRVPQRSAARQIEARINLFFQNVADKPGQTPYTTYKVAEARDEGIIEVYVPKVYQDDWEHFIGVVQCLYRNGNPDPRQARILADAAVQPGAYLREISYAFEGLGPTALPFVVPLMDTKKYGPDVNFAAARAAAFIGEASAPQALLTMAKTGGHPFQLAAVQTLGHLPNSLGLNNMLRELLDSDQTTIRVEAYKILARNKDSTIFTKVVNEQFVLDIVPSAGPPLIYASRSGLPRIALFGNRVSVDMPITFTAMDMQFQLSSDEKSKYVNLYYRGREIGEPLAVASQPDIANIIARLGGEGPPGERRFNFAYGDVVGLVQTLADQKKLTALASGQDAGRTPATFVLQEAGSIEDTIYQAPAIPGTGRPQDVAPAGEPRAMGN